MSVTEPGTAATSGAEHSSAYTGRFFLLLQAVFCLYFKAATQMADLLQIAFLLPAVGSELWARSKRMKVMAAVGGIGCNCNYCCAARTEIIAEAGEAKSKTKKTKRTF